MTAPVLKDLTPDEQRLYWLLYEDLLAGAQLGGQAALLELAQSGALKGAVDWAQANTGAATWAQNYLFDLVRELNQTTQDQLQRAVSAFQATPGMTRADLERLILDGPGGIPDLVSKTGRIIPAAERAEMIAVTEVTRSYTEGALEFTRASGLDMVEPEADKIPPLHVRCRCSLSAFTRDDGVTSWHFRTDNDDLVCEICGPLQNQDVGLPSPAAAVEPEAVKPAAPVASEAAKAARAKLAALDDKWLTKSLDISRQIREANAEIQLGIQGISRNKGFALEFVHQERVKVATAKLEELYKLRTTATAQHQKAALRVLQVDNPTMAKPTFLNKAGRYTEDALSDRTAAGRKQITKGFDEFGKLVETDVSRSRYYVNVRWPDPKSEYATRAYHQAGDVFLPGGVNPRTVIHELGHELEYYSADIHRKAVDFLEYRTAGEKAVKLKDLMQGYGYGETEIAKADKFWDAYVGKIYEGADGVKRATEIVSMGVERFWFDPYTFARTDPEYFDFIYDLLRGL